MSRRSWISLVAGAVVSLVAAYGAYTLANYSWNQVVDYRSPYAKAALPAGADPLSEASAIGTRSEDARAGRVVYVIIDGLREDVSRQMPDLNRLRAHGYDAVVRTYQPSLSFPNWTDLMSGAPQRISGVTTNWFTGRMPVETLVDVALSAHRTVAVSAPKDFQALFDVDRTGHVFLRDWTAGSYMTGEIVDHAISLALETSASLVVVHFPDVDEAGHAYGGSSAAYRAMALKVDADLGRLVAALQGPETTFIVTADHGHIDAGGHGGPEAVVTDVPAVFAGPEVHSGTGTGSQDQVAPTVALLAKLPAPRNAAAMPLPVTGAMSTDLRRFEAQQFYAYDAYIRVVRSGPIRTADLESPSLEHAAFDAATSQRLARERSGRLPMALALAALCLAVMVLVGVLSWRALVAAVTGTAAYYMVWDGLYFVVHGYRWSLSSFNTEAFLRAFLNGRMAEAIVGGVVAAAVAALVYVALRRTPRRARGEYLSGWLSLGVAAVLVAQATLGLQVAWYLWWWGASVTWVIPDLALGFKYDLDLIQITGLGIATVLAPVVTYLVGRYHPFRRGERA